jgi:archaellum component FlaG (FlaF/FlaG flagellin family)
LGVLQWIAAIMGKKDIIGTGSAASPAGTKILVNGSIRTTAETGTITLVISSRYLTPGSVINPEIRIFINSGRTIVEFISITGSSIKGPVGIGSVITCYVLISSNRRNASHVGSGSTLRIGID